MCHWWRREAAGCQSPASFSTPLYYKPRARTKHPNPRSAGGRPVRALDLRDPGFGGAPRDEPVEHLQRAAAVHPIRETHVRRRAVVENQRRRAEHTQLACGLAVLDVEHGQDLRTLHVAPKTIHVQPSI